MNVKTYCGHLPFCASSAFIAWTFCWPGAGGQCCHGASMESVCREMRCADTVVGGQVRGLAPSRKKSCLRVYVSCDHARLGKSQAGRRAGSKLHYPEYLGERSSVNPNRYKDFCVFALSQIYWKTFFASASIFSILFLIFIFEVPLPFKLTWFSFSFSSTPLSSTAFPSSPPHHPPLKQF